MVASDSDCWGVQIGTQKKPRDGSMCSRAVWTTGIFRGRSGPCYPSVWLKWPGESAALLRCLQNRDQFLNALRTGSKTGLFRHGQPTAHLVRSVKTFVAFLWQIAPIVPVLPTHPAYKSFAVNKTLLERHLHTVEFVGSNPLDWSALHFSNLVRNPAVPEPSAVGGSRIRLRRSDVGQHSSQ